MKATFFMCDIGQHRQCVRETTVDIAGQVEFMCSTIRVICTCKCHPSLRQKA
jgi:hypothetical protein